jgi:hypothetical protein
MTNQSPWLFLNSVDEMSIRNFSSGIEINMSFNSLGMSKSSRTFKTNSEVHDETKNFNACKRKHHGIFIP